MAEEFSGGCYVGLLPPHVLTSLGEQVTGRYMILARTHAAFHVAPRALPCSQLRTPFGRVHFGGTELATQWPGYMDGAIRVGEAVARDVLRALNADAAPSQHTWRGLPHSDFSSSRSDFDLLCDACGGDCRR